MRNTVSAVGLILILVILVGCETVKGVGKDIENTGQNVQEVVTPEAK